MDHDDDDDDDGLSSCPVYSSYTDRVINFLL